MAIGMQCGLTKIKAGRRVFDTEQQTKMISSINDKYQEGLKPSNRQEGNGWNSTGWVVSSQRPLQTLVVYVPVQVMNSTSHYQRP